MKAKQDKSKTTKIMEMEINRPAGIPKQRRNHMMNMDIYIYYYIYILYTRKYIYICVTQFLCYARFWVTVLGSG